MLDGLDRCHRQGVLHRDIKGANLLVEWNIPPSRSSQEYPKIPELCLCPFSNLDRSFSGTTEGDKTATKI
ncbi:hypothetical protein V6N11_007405 [Hibiscus sabdariffa]|uniref:Protein kinase domain-containing protein n=1 Tax=Hibiscus sabdariffa TaxID=183260 RepID=A0ABR2NRZ9_9ROSI